MYFVNKRFSISSLVFLFINSLFTHSTSFTVDPAAVLSIHELLPQTPSERCSILNNFAMKPAVFEYSLNEAIRSCLPLFSLSFFPSSSSSSSFFSLFFLIHFFLCSNFSSFPSFSISISSIFICHTEVTKLLLFLAQACHDLVPPDVLLIINDKNRDFVLLVITIILFC